MLTTGKVILKASSDIRRIAFVTCTSPLPHPATRKDTISWVAGWGSGLVQITRKGSEERSAPSKRETL